MAGPSIYRYFRSKDQILAELFGDGLDALMSRLGSRLEDPRDELDHLVETHAGFVVDHRELAAIVVRDARSLVAPYRRAHTRRQGRYIARWISCVERRYPSLTRDQATSATFAALHFLNSVALWPGAESRPEESTRLLREMVVGLLAPLEEVPLP
jgi:AcrR family transcriptional regulator